MESYGQKSKAYFFKPRERYQSTLLNNSSHLSQTLFEFKNKKKKDKNSSERVQDLCISKELEKQNRKAGKRGGWKEKEDEGEFLGLISKHSSCENIVIMVEGEDGRKNILKNVKSREELPLKTVKSELNNRTKSQKSKNGVQKKPSPNNLNRVLSNIQFRSPYKLNSITSKQNLSPFNHQKKSTNNSINPSVPSFNHLSNQIIYLRQQLNTLKTINLTNIQTITKQRQSYHQLNQQHILLTTHLNQQISSLTLRLQFKQQQFQDKTTLLLSQISQLIKDRQILQTKLSNLLIPPHFSSPQTNKSFIDLQQRINKKDQTILSLQHKIIGLQFQIQRTNFQLQRYNKIIPISNQPNKQYQKLQQIIFQKDQQICKLKQTTLLSQQQTQKIITQLKIQCFNHLIQIEENDNNERSKQEQKQEIKEEKIGNRGFKKETMKQR